MNTRNVTLIGVGNTLRRDGGLGWSLAKYVRKLLLPDAEVIQCSGDGTMLIENFVGKKIVFVFDAVRSGADPGTVFRFDARTDSIPSRYFNYSTHEFSVREAIELARVIQTVPDDLFVYGVEGRDFRSGFEVSFEVKQAFKAVLAMVQSDLKRLGIWSEGQIHV
jgi:hydrogenase maturation protease